MMSGDSPLPLPEFVEWREEFVNQQRGSRLVHYYLEDSSGGSHLAVVGTERSLRHMLYVVHDGFCRLLLAAGGSDDDLLPAALKWRARREVVNWLSSFLPRKKTTSSKSPCYEQAHTLGSEMKINGFSVSGNYLRKPMNPVRALNGHNNDIMWSGVSWTCGKQLLHYRAFCRNGITIAIHSFVLVMSEEENCYLAYLEDMYEDKKGQKKVKVRWFHQSQEFACKIPPPTPHPSEVFITRISQVISAECVDDVATVLTPDHYEKCLAMLPYSSTVGIRLCFRQYSKSKFKLFDVSTLRGYFNQAVLSCLDICTVSGEEGELGHGSTVNGGGSKRIRSVKGQQKFLTDHLGSRLPGHAGHITNCRPSYQNLRCDSTARRTFSVKFIGPRSWFTPPFKIDERIELLCQDSGIRGCWFKCTVLQVSHKRLKIQYDDILSEDVCGNLEEWIPAFRTAAPDKLDMRCKGRLTTRPCPSSHHLPENIVLSIGTAVDAWWSDGWWEGVVIGGDSCTDDSLQVYFPGENISLTCGKRSLRISRDWLGNQWVDIKAKPDILSLISSISLGEKLTACSILVKGAESGSSAMSDREAVAIQTHSNEETQVEADLGEKGGSPENTKQLTPRKRHRDEDAEGYSNDEVGIDYNDKLKPTI
ncbi:uncharacterized protein M6B38_365645 [Iris pallida]|uniref:BAH domain-containing protein n=1 Tax=Iris pallida TaxID=29817 RepID=A0AAX6GI25_IRIPA|nr:uncharacterized protein M6B38_365645 [Iris pallida]